MTIKVRGDAGAIFPVDLAYVFDFAALAVNYTIIEGKTFEGSGDYFQFSPSVIGQGRNFNSDLTQGRLDTLTIDLLPGQSTAGKITFSNINLNMAEFAKIVDKEINGDVDAIEKFMMKQGFNVVFDDDAQFGPENLTDGAGFSFNLRGKDVIRLKGGDDVFFLGNGADRGFGQGGNDTLEGGRGNDRLFGGSGQDSLFGQSGADRLFGGKGDDDLFGGAGKDRLVGGKGNDDLKGGKGADTFVFRSGHGDNTIRDFAENNNKEDIDLSGVKAIRNMTDLKANHMEQLGSDVLIDDNNGLTIFIFNADISDMNKADFIF